MRESQETYCRLCAERIPREQLISTEDEVAVTSKLITKMLWINIDIRGSSALPNTVCLSCFDQLEKTYMFLHNARTAQRTLTIIFAKISIREVIDCTVQNKDAIAEDVANPVDEDWELFQVTKQKVKDEHQIETDSESKSVDDSNLFECNSNVVKQEIHSDNDTILEEFHIIDTDTLNTTNCYLPSYTEVLDLEQTNLHNVKTAQDKFTFVFSKKSDIDFVNHDMENKNVVTENVTKPHNENWKLFQVTKKELEDKNEIKSLPDSSSIADSLLECNSDVVKQEIHSDNDSFLDECNIIDTKDYNTADSNLPFQLSEVIKNSEIKLDTEILGLKKSELNINVEVSVPLMTWDNYMCRCANCDSQCKNIPSLRQHSLQIHSRCCAFKCSDCSEVVTNYKSFVNHVRIHQKILRYCCEFCNKRFNISASVKKHLTLVHRDAYLTMCPNCGLSFETSEQLKNHILIYSKDNFNSLNRNQQRNKLDFNCEYCNKEFMSLGSLKQHKLIHTERSRDFPCHVCGKKFFTKGSLGTHRFTHKNIKPYECDICSKAFRTKGQLQAHISLHLRVLKKPFVCEQCGKRFRFKCHLKSHSMVHSDHVPYIYEYYNKSFGSKIRLNMQEPNV